VTFEGQNVRPVWSPDGTRVAFGSWREGSDDRDIYIKPVDEGGAAEHLLTRPGDQFPTDWTAEGTLTFNDLPVGAAADLWSTGAEGDDEPESFLATEWGESNLSVSPDGRWAAYQSNETGSMEVYVRAFPSGEGQRRVSTGRGRWPRWSPDGETIYFVRRGGIPDTLFAARVQLTPSFLVRSTDVVLTAGRISTFDVHPDGTRLVVGVAERQVVTLGEGSARGQVVVVLNWFEELQRRLGNN
jgi:dipeptidyl aminopeptidase/acylaminoacyl peptidase